MIMKKKIFMLIAMVMTTMSSSVMAGPAYQLTKAEGAEAHGKIVFKVDNTEVTSAEEGKEVSVCFEQLDAGFVVSTVSNVCYADWGQSHAPRRAGMEVLDSVKMTKVSDTEWKFTMPRSNVEVNTTYKVQIVIPTGGGQGGSQDDGQGGGQGGSQDDSQGGGQGGSQDDSQGGGQGGSQGDTPGEQQDDTSNEATFVEGVSLEMSVSEDVPVTVDEETGNTVIPVVVESVQIPEQTDATAEAPKNVAVAVAAEVTVGNNTFVVTEIKADAFVSTEPTAVVTKVVLPSTPETLKIEEGAMQPQGLVLDVETALSMLDDYALLPALKENFEQAKVSAKATSPNKYWSFSCGVDVKLPDGLLAYRAFNDNGTIRIVLLDEVNATKIIKANNGVLLACINGEGGDDYSFAVNPGGQASGTTPATTDAKSYEGNQLVPTIKPTNYESGRYLALKDNEFHPLEPSTTSKVPACKAVLDLQK